MKKSVTAKSRKANKAAPPSLATSVRKVLEFYRAYQLNDLAAARRIIRSHPEAVAVAKGRVVKMLTAISAGACARCPYGSE